MLPRSSVCLLKGVSKAVQGGSRGVATTMADLPEEHVSLDRPSNSDDGDSDGCVPRLHGRARCGSLPRRSSGPSLTPSTGRRASPRSR